MQTAAGSERRPCLAKRPASIPGKPHARLVTPASAGNNVQKRVCGDSSTYNPRARDEGFLGSLAIRVGHLATPLPRERSWHLCADGRCTTSTPTSVGKAYAKERAKQITILQPLLPWGSRPRTRSRPRDHPATPTRVGKTDPRRAPGQGVWLQPPIPWGRLRRAGSDPGQDPATPTSVGEPYTTGSQDLTAFLQPPRGEDKHLELGPAMRHAATPTPVGKTTRQPGTRRAAGL